MRGPRRWALIVGGLLVSAVLVVALFPDRLASVSPYYMAARTDILLGQPPFEPGPDHLLGTDVWGRDMWSRLVYGTRWSLLFASLIMLGRLLIAIPMGGLAAFGPKGVRWLVERLYVATSAIPPLLVYLMLLGIPALRQIGLVKSVIISVSLLTLIEAPRIATVLRGRFEALAHEEFVMGAIAVGAPPLRIFWNHMMPHLWPTLLHTIASEMGRALLVIAQLGIFQIFIGGGMSELIDIDGGNTSWPVIISGIPEWGSELADARRHLVWKPWIAMAPATAFLVGVVGFNLLAQGLEGVRFSLTRWKEATTGRLSARWRWALLLLPVGLIYSYHGGLPWGKESGIEQLASRQAEALTAGSVEEYLATIASSSTFYRAERESFARALLATEPVAAGARLVSMELSGNRATAVWRVSFGYRERSPALFERQVHLVRRHGRWYEEGEALNLQRGFYVDVETAYDPTDSSLDALTARQHYRLVATAADHAYAALDPLFPTAGPIERPRVKLYPTHEAYTRALGLEGSSAPTSTYAPGESIRISPQMLRGLKRWQIQQELSFELMKQMLATRGGSLELLPLALGYTELGEAERYELSLNQIADRRIRSLDELLTQDVTALPRDEMPGFMAQAATLAEYLNQLRPEGGLLTSIGAGDGSVGDRIAAVVGMERVQLAQGYEEYLVDRIRERSVMRFEGGRQRIPESLLASLAGRAEAEAVGAGITRYEVELLDMDPRIDNGEARVYVLERAAFEDGRSVSGVSLQYWRQSGDRWVLSRAPVLALP